MANKEKKYNVRKKGDFVVFEQVEVTEETEELTLDRVDSMVDSIIKQKERGQSMIDQAEAEAQELNNLLINAISDTKDADFKQRIKYIKDKLK